MKQAVLTVLFCSFAIFGYSQVEIKSNPVALIFGAVPLSIEKCIFDSWGAELDLLAAEGVFLAYVSGKHYFNPKLGSDGFNAGAFAGGFGGDESSAGIGFFAGHKSVSKKNVVFEIALGAGRGFGDLEVMPYFKFHLGYRISN